MNRPQGQSSVELDLLRALLLQPEGKRLDAVEADLAALGARVGDAIRLEAATAEILVEAFRRAEAARHRELANAVAPVVVAAIRSEIKNSKDMMVEALYPLTGRLVSAAVANAFRELVDNLNERMDRTLSTRHWQLRFRSLASGRSVSELALADAQAPALRRLMLLERGSGRLLAAWRADGEEDERSELASGLIAALTEFASSVYGAESGDLRTLDIGGARIFLRAAPVVLVAAECVGLTRVEHEREIDEAFLRLVKQLDDGAAPAQPALEEMAHILFQEAAPATKKTSKWPLYMTFAMLMAGLAWLASGPIFRSIKENAIEAAFVSARAKAPEISAYPMRVIVDHSAREARLQGLAPNALAARALTEAIGPAAQPYRMAQDVAVVASVADVENLRSLTDALGKRLDALSERVNAVDGLSNDRMSAAMQANQSAMSEKMAGVNAEMSALGQKLDALSHDLADNKLSERDKIAALLARTAIFFDRDDLLVDPALAASRLAAIAAALKDNAFILRVIGHADSIGGERQKGAVAQKRAQAVAAMLVAEGLPQDRLVVTARSALQAIGLAVPNDLRGRRVTFELGFEDEKKP